MRLQAHLILSLAAVFAPAAAASPQQPSNAATAGVAAFGTPPGAAPWAAALHAQLRDADARTSGDLGVHVVDLTSGHSVGYRSAESWYLASGVKIPVAIAVLRAIDAGELALDTELRLHADDLVDGAGPTKRQRVGSLLRVDWLIEQMLVHSDNAATDMLIRRIGLEHVNAVARELMADRCGPITTLADVRRHAYSALHEKAWELAAADLMALHAAPQGADRYQRLAQLVGVAPAELALGDIGSAFDAYYASKLNAAPLDAYAELLVALAEGRALQPDSTRYLLAVLDRVATGTRRIRAGLPQGVRFAHKTGTQLRRQCDFGIVTAGEGASSRRLVVTACNRDATSLRDGETALRAVGTALTRSGALATSPVPAIHTAALPTKTEPVIAPE